MRPLSFVILSAVLAPLVVRGQAAQAPVTGAKDLFYDPSSGSSASVQVPHSTPPVQVPRPTPPAPPAPRQERTAQTDRRRAAEPVAHRSTPSSPAVPAALRPNRGLHFWIELQEPSGQWSYVSNQEVFRSGQRIRLHFVSNVDGRILLIQLGASGTSSVLFPDPGKDLQDNQLKAGVDRVLPSENHWFRFDANPGTERLIALFAGDTPDLERFPVKAAMQQAETTALLQTVTAAKGSKDLVIETDTRTASAQVGTYGVNRKGEPVVLEIALQHR